MKISIIAAIGKNNEIGKKGDLPWNMPKDLKHFKEKTLGHTVIMGRKTFESIGKPLPKRKNIVITKNKEWKHKSVETFDSLDKAIKYCEGAEAENSEVFIIGGGEMYKQAIEIAHKLYITKIDYTDSEADTYFPEIVPIVFLETKREDHKEDDKNPYNYSFIEYERFF